LQKKLNYWPIDGDLVFKKIRAKLPEVDNIILKLDFIIKGGQKIGILANDKKFVQAIFDLLLKNIPYNQGELLLDGIRISELDSNLMKSKISIISSVKKNIILKSKEPFIIKGTLKENIDLEGNFNKDQIWAILQMIALKNLIQEKGFDYKVESEGRNLSTFDKIVISVIRAVLSVILMIYLISKKNKIIIVEDLDVIMNEKIQKLMEELFKSVFGFKTVLIATKKFDYILKLDRYIY
jgi:ABC-type multidrug transport system fused ATPase/permease subunit